MRHTSGVIAGVLGVVVLAGVAGCGKVAVGGPAPPRAHKMVRPSNAPVEEATMPPTKDYIAHLFNVWNAALATRDAERVAARYAPDAVLLPEFSNGLRTSRAAIADYYRGFLANNPQCAIKQSLISVLDEGLAVDSGRYVCALSGQAGQRLVELRFTLLYERRDGSWLIVQHHSSLMPERGS
jgi:uncharacterized protein (TIGR02246 family)